MTQAEAFIRRLESLKEGERSRLRRLAGQPLDHALHGFDLFTGLWWPLRQRSPVAPRRETSWLVAKLFGAFPLRYVPCERDCPTTLPFLLGTYEPKHPACQGAALLSSVPPKRDPARREFIEARRFRMRFDATLQTPLSGLEPHLRWALSVVQGAVNTRTSPGLDWPQLLEDISIWDRGEEHRRKRDILECGEEHRRRRDIRETWAELYLKGTRQTKGVEHAD